MLPRGDGDKDAVTGSRPELRIGAAVFAAALVYADVALAEVCDKVAPEWIPGSGRVTAASEVVRLVMSPAYIGILGLAGLAVVVARPLLAYFVGVACLFLAALVFLADGLQNEIMQQAVREGCITGKPIIEATYAAAGLLALTAGWMARRRRARIQAGRLPQ